VIVTRLVDVDETTTVVPGSTTVYPTGGRYGYYGHYGRSYDVVSSPGYTRTNTTVRLETQLWNAENSQLAWGIISETFDPKSTDDGVASVTTVLVAKLAKDGLLAP
jgi:hypothetical protein